MAVVGTRPDAIKMCPLIKELKGREELSLCTVATGQHRELLSDALDDLGVTPNINLDIMTKGQDLFDITVNVLSRMRDLIERESPDVMLVHGDTTSSFASALSAFYKKIPVCHVEAGLRTYNMNAPYPEEYNRRAIALIATHHFAPTERAKQNLLCEGVDELSVSVTGNTVIDAVRETVTNGYKHPLLDWAEDSKLILLTVHRRENQDGAIEEIFSAVSRILDEFTDVKVIYPVHPNPKIKEMAESFFKERERIKLCEPLRVSDFHNLLARSYLVLTDSGGIQEEAAALKKPLLVARNNTERREGIDAGCTRLVGTNRWSVYRGMRDLLENKAQYSAMSNAPNPYGDGNASKIIADIIEELFL